LDTNLRLTYISPSVERLRGFTVDAVMNQRLEEIFTPASLEVAQRLVEEELSNRNPERSGLFKLGTMGLEMLCKDGSTVWTETRVTMLYDPDGWVTELMGVTRDVSERKKADEELRKSEEKYRSLVENINAVIYSADVKGRITYLSPVVESFHGRSPVEFGGQHFSSFVHEEDLSLTVDSFKKTLSGKNEILEFRVVLPWSGEVRWSRSYNHPISDGDRVVGIQGVLLDVTDRKRMEEALRDSERRYRLLAENVTDVIWVTDLNWRRTYVSPSGRHLTGRNIGEAIEQPVQETLTADSRERAMKAFARQLAIEKRRKKDLHRSWTLQLEILRKDGSTVWTEDRVTFLRDPDGRPIGCLGVTRDISERKQAEDALRTLSHRLVEVQETERRQIARELHDEIGQALTGLKLLLETANRQPRRNLRPSLSEAQVLISELMARVQDMSLDLRPAMLDDLGLVPALLWHFERYTAQTGVKVLFEHRGLQRRFALEIETAVYRIVQEGLTNVARHAYVGEAMVRLVAARGILSVQIEDHGAGFDPDRTLSNGTSSGLNGMRERVALLGGQFRVNSTPEAGTRLTARFPIGSSRAKR
jgi:PAS domain S-box-containing protein